MQNDCVNRFLFVVLYNVFYNVRYLILQYWILNPIIEEVESYFTAVSSLYFQCAAEPCSAS